MPEVDPSLSSTESYDAKLAKDAIAEGEEKAQKVDVEADYEAAQQFSVSEVDRTGEGAAAAEAATAPQFELSPPEATPIVAEPTSDPADYTEMAREISSAPSGVANVSDDLVQQALKMGQPGSGQ